MPVSTPPEEGRGPLLELRAISKSFSGVRVLENVDFSVRPAEVRALVGENGAGKSTLMNVVSGVVAADSGEMLWKGRPVHLRDPRAAQTLGIAFVHQELALVPQLSAAENVFLGHHLSLRGGWVRWRDIHSRAAELFEELGKALDGRRLVSDLSMAEQQLVEIARALAFDARLIVMDEPTAPLAEADAESLFRTIGRLRDRGVSVVFISHRLNEIFRVADRVTVMRDGGHVLTADTSAVSQDDLVKAMVGSEFNRFAASVHADASVTEEALRVEGAANITVRRGEVVGLAGLAGAGRTELLESLFGIGGRAHPHLFVNGRPVTVRKPLDAIRCGIALVPDDRKAKGLVLGASLGANIALASGRENVFVRGAAEREAAGLLVRELRLRAVGLDQPVMHLSGGNQQKAVLAKWLFAKASIFLLDEPTRGIDVRSKAEIYELIRGLAARGAAILLASSETEELLRVADRIVVMHRGSVAGELTRASATEERIMHLATGGAN